MLGRVQELDSVEDLPPVTAELVMHRVLTEALIEVLGPKKGTKLLHTLAHKYADVDGMSVIHDFRTPARAKQLAKARREAASWFKRVAPHFMSKVP